MAGGIRQRWSDRIPDYIWAPLWEGALLLFVGACAWAVGQPWLFPSLGPTAYEQAVMPELRSARLYNVLVGHYVALAAGFGSLWLIGGWAAAPIVGTGSVSTLRLWASIIAAVITTLVNLVLHSEQPAALATTLLVTSGAYQNARGAVSILIGVTLIGVVGEPIRRIRQGHREKRRQREIPSQAA
jgi:hypothetical protein